LVLGVLWGSLSLSRLGFIFLGVGGVVVRGFFFLFGGRGFVGFVGWGRFCWGVGGCLCVFGVVFWGGAGLVFVFVGWFWGFLGFFFFWFFGLWFFFCSPLFV